MVVRAPSNAHSSTRFRPVQAPISGYWIILKITHLPAENACVLPAPAHSMSFYACLVESRFFSSRRRRLSLSESMNPRWQFERSLKEGRTKAGDSPRGTRRMTEKGFAREVEKNRSALIARLRQPALGMTRSSCHPEPASDASRIEGPTWSDLPD